MSLARVWPAVPLLLATGCGRLGFDPAPGSGPDAGAGPGGGLGAFGAPVRIPELASSRDDLGASISADGSQIVFASERSGALQLYAARRASPSAPFGAPAPIAHLDGASPFDPEQSGDSLELLYVTSSAPGLRRASRVDAASGWTSAAATMMAAGHEGPSLALDDLRMLIANKVGSGDATVLEEWQRASRSAPWALLRTHDTLVGMTWPAISADGLEAFVVSQEPSNRLFRATRDSADDAFGPPAPVVFGSELDAALVADPELSADGHALYLSIFVGDNFDIYVATR
ncbi:MAG TPA: hypothetical protein VHW23_24285 [Kofleriaceae bacterium]|jgi:hypothetical protein|nr:hypothetical protein [Kofleriaceae bacterium]